MANRVPEIIHEGFLFKKSPHKFKGWQKRWFVLTTESFSYRKTPEDSNVKGDIPIDPSTLVAEKGGLMFDVAVTKDVKRGQRAFHLRSQNEDDMKNWIQDLLAVKMKDSSLGRDTTDSVGGRRRSSHSPPGSPAIHVLPGSFQDDDDILTGSTGGTLTTPSKQAAVRAPKNLKSVVETVDTSADGSPQQMEAAESLRDMARESLENQSQVRLSLAHEEIATSVLPCMYKLLSVAGCSDIAAETLRFLAQAEENRYVITMEACDNMVYTTRGCLQHCMRVCEKSWSTDATAEIMMHTAVTLRALCSSPGLTHGLQQQGCWRFLMALVTRARLDDARAAALEALVAMSSDQTTAVAALEAEDAREWLKDGNGRFMPFTGGDRKLALAIIVNLLSCARVAEMVSGKEGSIENAAHIAGGGDISDSNWQWNVYTLCVEVIENPTLLRALVQMVESDDLRIPAVRAISTLVTYEFDTHRAISKVNLGDNHSGTQQLLQQLCSTSVIVQEEASRFLATLNQFLKESPQIAEDMLSAGLLDGLAAVLESDTLVEFHVKALRLLMTLLEGAERARVVKEIASTPRLFEALVARACISPEDFHPTSRYSVVGSARPSASVCQRVAGDVLDMVIKDPEGPYYLKSFHYAGPLAAHVSAQGILRVTEYAVHLQDVHAGHTSLNDEGLTMLMHLQDLRTLTLPPNVTPRSLAMLKSFPHLESLGVSGMSLTREGCLAIAELTSLKVLDVSECELTDDTLAELAALKDLVELNVSNNAITEASLTHFQSLVKLDISNTKIQNIKFAAAFPCLDQITR